MTSARGASPGIHLNGGDVDDSNVLVQTRRRFMRPGIEPKTYFWLVTGVSVAAGVLLAVAWAAMRPKG